MQVGAQWSGRVRGGAVQGRSCGVCCGEEGTEEWLHREPVSTSAGSGEGLRREPVLAAAASLSEDGDGVASQDVKERLMYGHGTNS